MLGAGTIINPIIKLVTVVIVLGAVYLFIVKPVLDTTSDAFETFGGAFDELPTSIQDTVDDALQGIDDDAARGRFERCIKEAGSNNQRINRCVERFTG